MLKSSVELSHEGKSGICAMVVELGGLQPLGGGEEGSAPTSGFSFRRAAQNIWNLDLPPTAMLLCRPRMMVSDGMLCRRCGVLGLTFLVGPVVALVGSNTTLTHTVLYGQGNSLREFRLASLGINNSYHKSLNARNVGFEPASLSSEIMKMRRSPRSYEPTS